MNNLNDNKSERWRYDLESPESILGSNFAHAVVAIAVGEQLNQKSLATISNYDRKPIFIDPRYNPPIQQAHISSGFDAHYAVVKSSWEKRPGTGGAVVPFSRQSDRKFKLIPDNDLDRGPTHPDHFDFLSEKELVNFGRTRRIRPFSRVSKQRLSVAPGDIEGRGRSSSSFPEAVSRPVNSSIFNYMNERVVVLTRLVCTQPHDHTYLC